MDKKIYYRISKGLIRIDLNEVFPMKPSKFDISHSVESYDKKTAENRRNFNDAEKRIDKKDINPKF